MSSLIYVAIFFLLIWGIAEFVIFTGKRNTRKAEQELQYDIMHWNIKDILKARDVNETSYNELSGYFSTLAKLPHKNREKSEVLWMTFMRKYKGVIDEINKRREMEEREIKSREEFDPGEVSYGRDGYYQEWLENQERQKEQDREQGQEPEQDSN
jgi:hypothetical protein